MDSTKGWKVNSCHKERTDEVRKAHQTMETENRKKMQELRNFLSNPKNSRSREALLMHRLIYDVELAACARGYFLEVYQSEVDQDGFDIILDDRDQIKKLQVKTVMSHSKTPSWGIHKCMLRPDYHLVEKMEFEPSPEGTGYQGGVVLLNIKCSGSSIDIIYHYTDVFILKAFDLEIISRRRPLHNQAIKKLFTHLQKGKSHEKIYVCKSAFLRVKSPAHLLALAGLHSEAGTSWPNSLLKYISSKKEVHKSFAAHELRKLVCDGDIRYCSPPLKDDKE